MSQKGTAIELERLAQTQPETSTDFAGLELQLHRFFPGEVRYILADRFEKDLRVLIKSLASFSASIRAASAGGGLGEGQRDQLNQGYRREVAPLSIYDPEPRKDQLFAKKIVFGLHLDTVEIAKPVFLSMLQTPSGVVIEIRPDERPGFKLTIEHRALGFTFDRSDYHSQNWLRVDDYCSMIGLNDLWQLVSQLRTTEGVREQGTTLFVPEQEIARVKSTITKYLMSATTPTGEPGRPATEVAKVKAVTLGSEYQQDIDSANIEGLIGNLRLWRSLLVSNGQVSSDWGPRNDIRQEWENIVNGLQLLDSATLEVLRMTLLDRLDAFISSAPEEKSGIITPIVDAYQTLLTRLQDKSFQLVHLGLALTLFNVGTSGVEAYRALFEDGGDWQTLSDETLRIVFSIVYLIFYLQWASSARDNE